MFIDKPNFDKALNTSIPKGRENAITLGALSARFKVSPASIKRGVSRLRNTDNGDDFIIISARDGYFRSDDPREIEAYVKDTRAQILNLFAMMRKARRVLRKLSPKRFSPVMEYPCNVQNMRLARGLTQGEFVTAINNELPDGYTFDKVTLSFIENGRAILAPRYVTAFMNVLECDILDIYPDGYCIPFESVG